MQIVKNTTILFDPLFLDIYVDKRKSLASCCLRDFLKRFKMDLNQRPPD